MEMFWLYRSFPGNYTSISQFSSAIAHKVVSLAPSLINRFDASKLVSVLIGCIGRGKFLDYQNYVELHACLKKAASQSSNDFGQLNNLMKPYIKIARLIKNELESKDGINFGFESVLSNVKKFKSFWFVFLPLFYKCCDYLNQYGCKSFVLLPVVSNKLSLISITELNLCQSVMRNKSFADNFKRIPKYSKAELFGSALHFVAVPIPALVIIRKLKRMAFWQIWLSQITSLIYVKMTGEQMLVVQGHNREQQAIEQVETLAERGALMPELIASTLSHECIRKVFEACIERRKDVTQFALKFTILMSQDLPVYFPCKTEFTPAIHQPYNCKNHQAD
ncbi:hypothetical protein MP228_002082 [Amoeboaphelidium protococcarum]|nr:hypothetical protein MP228_002082 [Amoeboaphelidium protococcarum]